MHQVTLIKKYPLIKQVIFSLFSLFLLSSCYKNDFNIVKTEKNKIRFLKITYPKSNLPINMESQHVLTLYSEQFSSTEDNTEFSLVIKSSLGLTYYYTMYFSPTDGLFTDNTKRYILLNKFIPFNQSIINKTDTTLIYIKGIDWFSDTVCLITKIVPFLSTDSLFVFKKFSFISVLREHIKNFSFSTDSYLLKHGDINFNGYRFYSVWSDGSESGKINIDIDQKQNSISSFEFLNLYSNFTSTEEYKFTSSFLFINNICNDSICIGYYGPDLLKDISFTHTKSPHDTIFSRGYYSNINSYISIVLTK